MSETLDRSVLHGWERFTLRTDQLELGVVPALGGTLLGLTRRGDERPLTYSTPWGLPGPGTGLLGGSADELRADTDPGGWQTLFPNAGDNAIVDGIEWGVDGETRVTPFVVTELRDDPDAVELRMTGRLRRSPFAVTKTVRMSGDTVTVTEQVEHQGRERSDVLWGSRICLGAPLVGPTAEIDCGASLVHPDGAVLFDADYADVFPWPRTAGRDGMINLRYLPEPGTGEDRAAYLTGFGDGWAEVRNPGIGVGLRLGWDTAVWPHLWYRLVDGGDRGHPWFGTERFLTLTPCSGWPARGLHDARRISGESLALDPGETRSAELTLQVQTLGSD